MATTGFNVAVMSLILSILVVTVIKGIIQLRKTHYLMKSGVHVIGSIIGATKDNDSDSNNTFKTIIEFDALDGGTYNFKSSIRIQGPPRIGKKVDVLYDEKNPKRAIQFTEHLYLHLWIGTLLALAITAWLTIYYIPLILKN